MPHRQLLLYAVGLVSAVVAGTITNAPLVGALAALAFGTVCAWVEWVDRHSDGPP
jgi:hypothetical protein